MAVRRWRTCSIAAAFAGAFALAGCSGIATMNNPLPPAALSSNSLAISHGGYRLFSLKDMGSPDVLVALSFSGGGMRSAAFGYGVLRGMRDFPLTIEGRTSRLLDEIDVMSSVSGGSFPAAYYGLYRDKIFTDFENDFLHQNIENYVWGTYLIPWHLGWLVDPNYGTNDRMAEVYDKLMFHGATYADLIRAGRPMVAIAATDVDHELSFPFLQSEFDLLCSDLTSYPVARAVAASNGFPVVFTPITLKSYRPQCAGRVPDWVRDNAGDDPFSRLHREAQSAELYLDADRTRYVHLMDGGISDNLAMRSMISAMIVFTSEAAVDERYDLTRIRRILLISADGQAANNGETAKSQHLSGLGQIFNAVSGTQIDSYNFETMVLAKEELDDLRNTIRKQRCEKGPVSADGHPCGDVQSFFAHLSLAGVTDAAERERLQKIPTGLSLEPADVTQLVAAGEKQVKASADLAAFRDSLAGK